jgi:predicted nuclease of predicted toxin-antitoxin system
MRLYVDEDLVSRHLIQALKRAGHDVSTPGDVALLGHSDTVQLTHAVSDRRICLTRNATDYEDLHNLILVTGGTHPGILTVRADNDRRRDMQPSHIVVAIKNVSEVLATIQDHVICLNDWR